MELREVLKSLNMSVPIEGLEQQFVDSTDSAQDICIEIIGRSIDVRTYCDAFKSHYTNLIKNVNDFCVSPDIKLDCENTDIDCEKCMQDSLLVNILLDAGYYDSSPEGAFAACL